MPEFFMRVREARRIRRLPHRAQRVAVRARQLERETEEALLEEVDRSLEREVDGHLPASSSPPTLLAETIVGRPLATAARRIVESLGREGVGALSAAVVVVEMRRRLVDFAVEAIDRKLRARLWSEPEITGTVARVRARGEDRLRDSVEPG